jgi:hypothetical protein
MKLFGWLSKRRAVEQPRPLPEDEPLWVVVDRELATAGVPRATRREIAVRVENWELRRELKELHELPRTIMVNPVHNRVHTPGVTKPRNCVTTKPKRNRAAYMRTYRANQAKLRVVTRDGDAA